MFDEIQIKTGPGVEIAYRVVDEGITIAYLWVGDGLAAAPPEAKRVTIEPGDTFVITSIEPDPDFEKRILWGTK